jgi:hypothetical protein
MIIDDPSKTQTLFVVDPADVRARCFDAIMAAASAGVVPQDFDPLREAAALAARFPEVDEVGRFYDIIRYGHGTTAEEIFRSGSEIVAFIRDGAVPR